jgi:hypothetical protein
MSAQESPQSVLVDLFMGYGLSEHRASSLAESVVDTLMEADRDMIEAGAFELRAAGLHAGQSRRAAERVWVAMLRKACG